MKTITRDYNLYQFYELSEEAKKSAYSEWMQNSCYVWNADNERTMKCFEEIFNITINDWNYDTCTYYYRFTSHYSGEEEELCGIRLLKYLVNNYWKVLFPAKEYWTKGYTKSRKSRIFVQKDCVLTDYCADYEILLPIYDFMKSPDDTTLYELVDRCLEGFFKYCRDDMEQNFSEEAFEENCAVENYEFLSDGKMFTFQCNVC